MQANKDILPHHLNPDAELSDSETLQGKDGSEMIEGM